MKRIIIVAAILMVMAIGGFSYLKGKRPWLLPFYWKIPYNQTEMGGMQFQPKTLIGLNQIRITTQKRFNTTSGYRSPAYNRKKGGVYNSMHIQGLAVDVTVPLSYREEFYQAAKKAGFTAFGWGENTIHIDMGKRRWWTYNPQTGKPNGGRKYLHFAPAGFHRDFQTYP